MQDAPTSSESATGAWSVPHLWPPPTVVVGVLCSQTLDARGDNGIQSSLERRNVIRDTWQKTARSLYGGGDSLQVVFVVGGAASETHRALLTREAAEHNDMLVRLLFDYTVCLI
jgi:hypothetical protein